MLLPPPRVDGGGVWWGKIKFPVRDSQGPGPHPTICFSRANSPYKDGAGTHFNLSLGSGAITRHPSLPATTVPLTRGDKTLQLWSHNQNSENTARDSSSGKLWQKTLMTWDHYSSSCLPSSHSEHRTKPYNSNQVRRKTRRSVVREPEART